MLIDSRIGVPGIRIRWRATPSGALFNGHSTQIAATA
jgi:hypothetical protein